MSNKTFGIIIDTEQYSGNFERELCAFLTGRVGECGVGEEYAHENPLFDNVVDKSDEEGCRRPCETYPTPNWFNNGWGGHFREGEEKEALEQYKKDASEYLEPQIRQRKEIEEKLISGEEVKGWTLEGCKEEIKMKEKELKNKLELKQVNKFPAHLSVLIHIESYPTKEQIEYIKENAPLFQDIHRNKKSYLSDFECKITGIRILETEIKSKTVKV